MQARNIIRTFLSLALVLSIATPAEAQLGRIGGAIKKKAGEKVSETVGGKEKEPEKTVAPPNTGSVATPSPTTAAPAAPVAVTIDDDVLTRFGKSLDLEISRRSIVVKRAACVDKVASSQEAMDLVMWISGEQDKIQDSKQSDEKKQDAVKQLVTDMERKKEELEVKKCGAAVPESTIPAHEKVAAEAGGFSHPQYAGLKERILPYCNARAKGSDTPSNAKLVYTEAEMIAMRPRCTALLATLKKLG